MILDSKSSVQLQIIHSRSINMKSHSLICELIYCSCPKSHCAISYKIERKSFFWPYLTNFQVIFSTKISVGKPVADSEPYVLVFVKFYARIVYNCNKTIDERIIFFYQQKILAGRYNNWITLCETVQ